MSKKINKLSENKPWFLNFSNERSIFGWIIKEEIFAIFFILVIVSLSNDETIVKKVSNNIYIQIFIGLIFLYCIYNRIPWSLAFILVLLISILFSTFVINIKESFKKIFLNMNNSNNITDIKTNPLRHIGAKVVSWISKEQEKNKVSKSILKKNVNYDNDECKKISELFHFNTNGKLEKGELENEELENEESENEESENGESENGESENGESENGESENESNENESNEKLKNNLKESLQNLFN